MKASMVGLRFKGRYVYNLFGRCAQTERKNRAADYPLALAQLDLGEIEDYSGSAGYHPDGEVDYALVWLKISGWADFKTSIRMKINTISSLDVRQVLYKHVYFRISGVGDPQAFEVR